MITTVDTVEIPLFPLGTVLFPDGVLPLKLFEARYLDMAARCMRANAPFGVCLIREGGEVGEPALPHDIGAMARIVDWDMAQPGLLFIRKPLVTLAIPIRRPPVQQIKARPMKPVGIPIRSKVGAVPPDRPYLLPTHRLPDILAIANILPGEQHLATAHHHPLRNRRRLPVDLPAIVTKDKKRTENNN